MLPYRMLVIDDDARISAMICNLGKSMGFETAANCDLELPRLYQTFMPHVIVLDVIMPDMDGFEVIRFLHKQHCPASIITISGEPGYAKMAAQMADAFGLKVIASVSKPFLLSELRRPLEKTVRSLVMRSRVQAA